MKRALLDETVYRCASCLCSIEHCEDDGTFFRFDEKAHINPHSNTQDDSFENLITLCPTCHTKFDKNKDREKSLERLRSLKRQWLGISGKYSKLEIDCLLELYKPSHPTFIISQTFTQNDKQVQKPSFCVPVKQSYLFWNLIKNKLVVTVEQRGAFQDNRVIIGVGMPAEDMYWIILTLEGNEFCKKLYE